MVSMGNDKSINVLFEIFLIIFLMAIALSGLLFSNHLISYFIGSKVLHSLSEISALVFYVGLLFQAFYFLKFLESHLLRTSWILLICGSFLIFLILCLPGL